MPVISSHQVQRNDSRMVLESRSWYFGGRGDKIYYEGYSENINSEFSRYRTYGATNRCIYVLKLNNIVRIFNKTELDGQN